MANPQPVTRQAVAVEYPEPTPTADVARPPDPQPAFPAPERRPPEPGAKVIEFPRTAYAPPIRVYELAEPMLDRPRILEAPEVVPPPPALGGMTIEQAERPEPERRPGIDMPLRSAPASKRLLAMGIDSLVILAASGIFGAIVYRIAGVRLPVRELAEYGTVLLAAFWFAYYYLLMVYSGSTPGLRALKLELRQFDGRPAMRRKRRARVLCGLLSAAALGLGFAWQFLDEDALYWHERVTRTHIAPQPQEQKRLIP
jgi:uncharacterized RDD family membrane protein YckC